MIFAVNCIVERRLRVHRLRQNVTRRWRTLCSTLGQSILLSSWIFSVLGNILSNNVLSPHSLFLSPSPSSSCSVHELTQTSFRAACDTSTFARNAYAHVRGNRYFTYVTLTPSLVKTSHVGDDYSGALRDDKINMILYARMTL